MWLFCGPRGYSRPAPDDRLIGKDGIVRKAKVAMLVWERKQAP